MPLITINGETKSVQAEDLQSLLTELGLVKNKVVLELNRQIVLQERYGQTNIKSNDILEIVTFVGGG